MRKMLQTILCAIVLLVVVGGCPFGGEVYEDDLVAGYVVWASDVIEDAAIFLKDPDGRGGVQVVPPMVIAYGWNNEFIIAKRRPAEHGRITGKTTEWYIIQVGNRRTHGPLSEDEFSKLRTELRVPSELSFTTTVTDRVEPTRGGNRGIPVTPYSIGREISNAFPGSPRNSSYWLGARARLVCS
jgi:hypothetical protein